MVLGDKLNLREVNHAKVEMGAEKLKRLFIWNEIGMRSKCEDTFYFYSFNFNYINALILIGWC